MDGRNRVLTPPSVAPSKSNQAAGDTVKVKIEGLRRILSVDNYGKEVKPVVVSIPASARVADWGDTLITAAKQQSGESFMTNCSFQSVNGHPINTRWMDVSTLPVTVTHGRSCYDKEKGLQINRNQSIAAFFSYLFPNPIETSLSKSGQLGQSSPFCDVASSSVEIGNDRSDDLVISFMRTVRVPENSKDYDLPPGLGKFPLFNVLPFSKSLPESMVSAGGIFLPMYQMEAMWINFECKRGKKFVIRPFLGGVNGITGEPLIGDMSSMLRRLNRLTPVQDYLILPDQIWLDGIATKPGSVRQFVATETAPPRHDNSSQPGTESNSRTSSRDDGRAGSSVEWQVTGRDAVGGIQLQIIPTFDVESMFAGSARDVCPQSAGSKVLRSHDPDSLEGSVLYDVLKSPLELGLIDANVIHVKNMLSLQSNRPKTASDVAIEGPTSPSIQWDLELSAKYPQGARTPSKWTFYVSLYPNRTMLTLKFSSDDDFTTVLRVIRSQVDHVAPSRSSDGSILSIRFLRDSYPKGMLRVSSWADLEDALLACKSLNTDGVRETLEADGSRHYTAATVWTPPDTGTELCICRITGLPRKKSEGREPWFLVLPSRTKVHELKKKVQYATVVNLSHVGQISVSGVEKADHDSIVGPGYSGASGILDISFGNVQVCICIETLTGEAISLSVLSKDTVLSIKQAIQRQKGFPVDEQTLFFGHKALDDSSSVSQNLIVDGATLNLLMLREGPMQRTMQIFVSQKGGTIGLQVESSFTIDTVKRLIERKIKYSSAGMALLFGGKALEDGRLLSDYYIRDVCQPQGSQLYSVFRCPGGGGGDGLYVRYNGDTYSATAADINGVKLLILEQLGIPVRSQRIMFEGMELGNDIEVAPYFGQILELEVEEERVVRPLAVGAGGSIVQAIVKDVNDPRIWDIGNSKILSMQLVDSRTFKLATGMDPPPTPVTAATYKNMGLPFYQFEEGHLAQKKTGAVAGNWPSLAGAKESASATAMGKGKGKDVQGVEDFEYISRREVWGLLESGYWGKLEAKGDSGRRSKDASFAFPVVMLDVDERIPAFKSVVEAESEDYYGAD